MSVRRPGNVLDEDDPASIVAVARFTTGAFRTYRDGHVSSSANHCVGDMLYLPSDAMNCKVEGKKSERGRSPCVDHDVVLVKIRVLSLDSEARSRMRIGRG